MKPSYGAAYVILSQTATGLQNAINILNNFCNKWKLNVNLKKTKVVVFQKKQRKEQRYKFFLNTNVVDIVNECTYLGIKITSNGKFIDGVEILREKAKFAMGAFQKRFNLSRLPLDVVNIIFLNYDYANSIIQC